MERFEDKDSTDSIEADQPVAPDDASDIESMPRGGHEANAAKVDRIFGRIDFLRQAPGSGRFPTEIFRSERTSTEDRFRNGKT